MGITDLFEKLINEHGSATILKERVVALKDQAIELEKEKSSLKSENAILKEKIKNLELERSNIEKEKAICQDRLKHIHSITSSEKHEELLISVATSSGHYPAALARTTGLSEQETVSKLNYLSSLGLLHYRHGYIKDQNNPKDVPKPVNLWFVSGTGHAYIRAHNLNDKIA